MSALQKEWQQDMSDQEKDLFLQYRNEGSEAAFTELVNRVERPLFGFLRAYLGSESDAEDVLQETLMQLVRKHGQFDIQQKFRTWLFTIARNRAVSFQRYRKSRPAVSLDRIVHPDDDETTRNDFFLARMEDHAEDPPGEKMRHVQDAIAQLPATQRQSIDLIYGQGLKYREAAAIAQIPEGTIKVRLHRAIVSIREQICPLFEAA